MTQYIKFICQKFNSLFFNILYVRIVTYDISNIPDESPCKYNTVNRYLLYSNRYSKCVIIMSFIRNTL